LYNDIKPIVGYLVKKDTANKTKIVVFFLKKKEKRAIICFDTIFPFDHIGETSEVLIIKIKKAYLPLEQMDGLMFKERNRCNYLVLHSFYTEKFDFCNYLRSKTSPPPPSRNLKKISRGLCKSECDNWNE
jgi:hypothetical protein